MAQEKITRAVDELESLMGYYTGIFLPSEGGEVMTKSLAALAIGFTEALHRHSSFSVEEAREVRRAVIRRYAPSNESEEKKS